MSSPALQRIIKTKFYHVCCPAAPVSQERRYAFWQNERAHPVDIEVPVYTQSIKTATFNQSQKNM
jgi:hypothetical protein